MQASRSTASTLQLLGFQWKGLPAALAAPLLLTAALFAGPLLLLAWPAPPEGPTWSLSGLPRLQARLRLASHVINLSLWSSALRIPLGCPAVTFRILRPVSCFASAIQLEGPRPCVKKHFVQQSRVMRLTAALQVVRNVAVAPLTEEFVFRACMAPLLLARVRSRASPPQRRPR